MSIYLVAAPGDVVDDFIYRSFDTGVVRKTVIAEPMFSTSDFLNQPGILLRILADHEEQRARAILVEHIEHFRSD